MSANPANPYQKGRISALHGIHAAGRKSGNKPRNVKKRARELSVWSISPPRRAFSCGKIGIPLLKEISFLPQRRKFLAAKKFPGVWKAGKIGASGGFFLLVGDFPCAKSVCPFASLSPSRADAGAVSVRTASRAGRQSVAETGPVAFILRSGKLARFACLHPSPPLRPSVRFSRGRF